MCFPGVLKTFVITIAVTALTWTAGLAQQIAPRLSVATLNMAKEKDVERILRELQMHPPIWDSDVWLLQEVAKVGGGRHSIASALAKETHRYAVMSAPGGSNRDSDGLAIISRFPLTDFEETPLRHNNMVFHTRNRMAIAATVQSPLGRIRVYNIHLDSRINTQARLKQLEPVISKAAQWDGPCLIGGDFNTNYIRWAGNFLPIGLSSQGHAVQNAMATRGFTTPMADSGPTEHVLGLRLDWFYTRAVRPLETATEPIDFSDHRAVRMTLAPEVRLSQATR